MKKMTALRGAAFIKNDGADIAEKAAHIYDALLARNNLAPEDCVSLVFSITHDIDAKNPAEALRESGRAAHLALFCVQEPHFAGSRAGVLRALLHCYAYKSRPPSHAYIDGAEILRPDL